MKIDIFDTTVPDYSILDKKSLMESLGYESETSLRNAVDSGFIPPLSKRISVTTYVNYVVPSCSRGRTRSCRKRSNPSQIKLL